MFKATNGKMSFGAALDALKLGGTVGRAGWNGKGMFLSLVLPHQYEVITRVHGCGGVDLGPWIGMKTADDKFVPWLASQTDLLSEDWEILGQK